MQFGKPVLSHPNFAISSLMHQLQNQNALLSVIKDSLPADLTPHVLHCVINKNKLTIYADKPSWASLLRYHCDNLQSVLAIKNPSIKSIQIKLFDLMDHQNPKTPRKIQLPSDETIENMLKFAQNVLDPELNSALTSLANRLYVLKSR